MHRVQSRTYVGQPGESVSVSTTPGGGAQVSVSVAGQPIAGGNFHLPQQPGATVRMQIALAGPQGASCVVSLANVDAGSDTDFLLCTVFNPAPVNFYDFSVAALAAVTTLAAAKGVPVAAATASKPDGASAKRKTSRGGK